ncbi:MAG: GlxA family transcriptional regulator [Mesorhizobium sp.]|nr:MAG: GlxA family transcriptional regulator [Mesorhizobium sp.]TIV81273.1 MAG: GlxA family transcriptional regulator [Mesorhizobium sp.]
MRSSRQPRRFGFFLCDGYALMSVAAAVEPLRAANLLTGRTLYELLLFSDLGGKARSSVGSWFDTAPIGQPASELDILFVVAGGDPLSVDAERLSGILRRLSVQGVALGGISGGAAILHKAGLLERRRFTIHWKHYDALRAIAPDALMERRLFVIDRDRFTCAGGSAPLDMMHALIAAHHGASLAREVSDWFIHTSLRPAEDPQRLDARSKYGVHHPALIAMIALMEDHIADPMSLPQLATLSGIGERQLERVCKTQLDQSVMQFYRKLRLSKAVDLLRQTTLSVTEVALATGFSNNAHFARAYRQHYGTSPMQERRPTVKRQSTTSDHDRATSRRCR